jgi:hypothetical protein
MLRTDLNPVERMISEYAVGDYGFLMTLAFLFMAVAILALMAGLAQLVPEDTQFRLGIAFVGVFAVGMFIFAVFPIGVGETVDSTSDLIHRMTAPFAFFSLTVGVFLVSRGFRRDPRLGSLYALGLVLAALMLTASVGFFVSYGAEVGIYGLFQRVFIFTFVVWFIVVASKIRASGAPQTME